MFQPRKPYASQSELDAQRGQQGVIDVESTIVPEGEENPGMDGELIARDPEIKGGKPEPSEKIELFRGEPPRTPDQVQKEETHRRHAILMASLEEEGERQAEERQQAQIDDDYYHHQQWKAEEARVLQARGQAPLVFNEARGAIDWLCGTERKLRKDYKIRPRSREDEQMSEIKTKTFKYVDDVNLAAWHRSRAFKQMATSGLGWLEENLNTDPTKELIFSGSEDWRRVFRDSRGREFDQSDWRYIHRRRVMDLDYAVCLLPTLSQHLTSIAGRWAMEDDEADDIWYLGEKLTSAHAGATSGDVNMWGDDYKVRRAGASIFDNGRRSSVEIIETYYRIPERVKVFAAGPLWRKQVNPADPRHQQLLQDKWNTYEAVKMRMRCMVGTKYQPGWDGASPFGHGEFPLVPLFGYRRDRDGVMYGAMRGMRDPQDDLNKRRSKALYALSATRAIVKKDAVDDMEALREEIARVDAVLEVNDISNIKVDAAFNAQQVQGNLEMAMLDAEHIRNVGGVTGENLGHETSAQSGKAIIAKQQQGSMVTYELFDNFFLAFKMAGQRRMSNIEQFCNQEWTFRLDPQGMKPAEWVTVNEFNPITGDYKNDITRGHADFIIDQQDYRATLSQAAMESMFELLGNIATFAPMVVLNLLDLAVEHSDVQGKDEWVARIRKMTGQRDPSKPPTPEEMQAEQMKAQKEGRMEELTMQEAEAKVGELKAKITKLNADSVLANLNALLSAVDAAATVATIPAVAPAADALARSAGFKDADGGNVVEPIAVQPQPAMAEPMLETGGEPVPDAGPALPAAPTDGAAVQQPF